jgi:hypothetical protein
MALPDNVPLDKNSMPYPLVYLQSLVDDAFKGLMRSVGDAGDAPLNETGKTVLAYIQGIDGSMYYIDKAVGRDLNAATFTTTPLAASATYTGTAKDFNLARLGFMLVMAFADQDGTIYMEQSHDNSNWDYSENQALTGGTADKLKSALYARYVRPKYVNGGTDQTTFRFGGRYSIA